MGWADMEGSVQSSGVREKWGLLPLSQGQRRRLNLIGPSGLRVRMEAVGVLRGADWYPLNGTQTPAQFGTMLKIYHFGQDRAERMF